MANLALPAVAPSYVPTVAPYPVPTVAPGVFLSGPFLDGLQSKYQPVTKPHLPSRPLSPTSVAWEPPAATPSLDELDQLIEEASQLYLNSSSWEEFVPKVRDARGNFHPVVGTIPHPSAHLLNCFQIGGAPVACSGTPWSFAQKAAALTRGPHQSARQHIPFLRQEFVDMIRKGQWTLLPARLVLNELQLRLSPLGVVPQRDRRPRTSRTIFIAFGSGSVMSQSWVCCSPARMGRSN
jgi:hypothetical protein